MMNKLIVLLALAFAALATGAQAATVPPSPATEAKKQCTAIVPCPEQKKPAARHKKKAPKKAAPAPTALAAIPAVSGCKEIHFPTKGSNEPAVRVAFFTSGNPDVVKTSDVCTTKNEGRLLECVSPEVCNFSRAEKVLGKTFVMAKTYPTTEGEHVLYVPEKYLDPKEGVLVCLYLVHGDDSWPTWNKPVPYDPKVAYRHNEEVIGWMKSHYSDGICVGHFDYTADGIATIYHSQAEMPADTRIQMYFPPLGTSLFN